MKGQKPNQFDFSRNDKFYALTVPRHSAYDDVILYEFHLKDLVNNKEYINFFRFKELKEIHQNLLDMKLELPEFPKTHFWRKTNKNPQLISERRIKLEYYFQIIVNDPYTRGYPQIKNLIRKMKQSNRKTHRFSSPHFKSGISTNTSKSQSLTKMNKQKIDFQTLKQMKKLGPTK